MRINLLNALFQYGQTHERKPHSGSVIKRLGVDALLGFSEEKGWKFFDKGEDTSSFEVTYSELTEQIKTEEGPPIISDIAKKINKLYLKSQGIEVVKKSWLPEPSSESQEIFQEIQDSLLSEERDFDLEKLRDLVDRCPVLSEIKQKIIADGGVSKIDKEWDSFIYTLFGVKPVWAYEETKMKFPKNIQKALSELQKINPHLKMSYNPDGEECYVVVNEKPLDYFNFRTFVDFSIFDRKGRSVEEAFKFLWLNSGRAISQQILSYMLGYGPSWEALWLNKKVVIEKGIGFEGVPRELFPEKIDVDMGEFHREPKVFLDEHYRLRGAVLLPDATEEEQIERGKRNPFSDDITIGDLHPEECPSVLREFVLDNVALKSEYSMVSAMCRERLCQIFGLKF